MGDESGKIGKSDERTNRAVIGTESTGGEHYDISRHSDWE